MDKVLALCRPDLTKDECIKNLCDNPGQSLLAVDIFNDLFIFHQVHFMSPSLLIPDEKILALTDFSNPSPSFHLHMDSLFQTIKVNVPKWAQLKSADSVESIMSLTAPENNSNKFRSLNVIVIPPLVLTTILSMDSLDIESLILLLVEAFKEDDKESEKVMACTIL